MLRLPAISRGAWWPTGVLLTRAITHNVTVAKRKNRTKKTSKKITSTGVTPRLRSASPVSGGESTARVAVTRAVAPTSRVTTDEVTSASAHAAGISRRDTQAKLAASVVCLAPGVKQTCAKTLDSDANVTSPSPPLPPSSLLSSSPSPPPVPHVNSRSFSLTTLQRRIRSLLVQLILLSAEPLRPSALFAHYRRAVDKETSDMCAWAAHAVYQYDHGLLRYSEAKAKTQQIDQHKAGATADVDHSENTLGSDTEAEEERVLWSQGQQLSRAFCASVVPLVATLCSKGEATTSVVPRLPASHEVEQWIFLSIIFSDAEFRVSPYSGTVSYPALPSMLLATIDPMRDREVAKLCYALQWGSQAKATAYAGFCQAGASDGATYLSSTTSRKQGHLPSFPLDTAREQAAPGMDNFVWLDGAAGSPTWTTAHGQYLLHSALTSARKSFDESVIGAPASSVGLSADEQLRKTIAASAEQHHTSGHPLVDVMLQVSSAAGGVTRSRGCPSSDAHASARGGGKTPAMTRGAAAAAAQPPALGWNEGKKGADVATSFVTDASDDGTFAVMMGDLATRGLSAGAMCEINRRLIAHLFRKLTALPVSLARLSTVVRWNLSVAYAGHYRSFFYFLLLTAANPMVHRMADGRRHRRRANVVCADVWAEKHADSNESGCRLEDEVCNALAQYDPCTFRGFQDRRSTEGGGTMAALRRAFAADADVTKKCEYTASDVMEVMCIRVLPHRRPGQRLSAAAAPGDSTDDVRSVPAKRATFCGYPLHFVEVLPTWRQTPEEVLQYLWLQQDPGHLSSINTNWLEKNEEPYILAFSLDRGVLDRRLRLVVDRYLDLTRRAAYPTVSPNDAATRRVTLHELGLMTLWTHEYGAEMSAELLFVLLLLRHDEVRMHPPLEGRREFRDEGTHTRLTTTSGNSHTATTPGGYGSWTVEFLPQ